jgi:hypothetical protein
VGEGQKKGGKGNDRWLSLVSAWQGKKYHSPFSHLFFTREFSQQDDISDCVAN